MSDFALPGAERKAHFRETFERRKLAQRTAIGLGMVALFIAYRAFPDGGNIIVVPSLLAAVGLYVFAFFNWRCASCYGHLGTKVNIHYCSQCGFRLD